MPSPSVTRPRRRSANARPMPTRRQGKTGRNLEVAPTGGRAIISPWVTHQLPATATSGERERAHG
jgi:hypothetical protein